MSDDGATISNLIQVLHKLELASMEDVTAAITRLLTIMWMTKQDEFDYYTTDSSEPIYVDDNSDSNEVIIDESSYPWPYHVDTFPIGKPLKK